MFGWKRGAAADKNARSHTAAGSAEDHSRRTNPQNLSQTANLRDSADPPVQYWRPSRDQVRASSALENYEDKRKSVVGLMPPVLPPIPRVASKYEKDDGIRDTKALKGSEREQRPLFDSDNHLHPSLEIRSGSQSHVDRIGGQLSQAPFHISSGMNEYDYRAPTLEQRSGLDSPWSTRFDRSSPSAHDESRGMHHDGRPHSSGLLSGAISSYANRQHQSSFDQHIASGPTRSPLNPTTQASRSTPDLLSSYEHPAYRRSITDTQDLQNAALTPFGQSPSSAISTTDPNNLLKSSHRRPNPSQQSVRPPSSQLSDTSSQLSNTIGTRYEETSQSFPLPQSIATRPKPAAESAVLGGYMVPTHHTANNSSPTDSPHVEKMERRRTRLLSPFALLSKRRATQNNESINKERAAQEQALARQRDVAAIGVSKLPEGYDPRIKGKGVHDFSAPRAPKRNVSYGDTKVPSQDSRRAVGNSAPVIPAINDLEPLTLNTALPEPARRSSHVPVFMEHLAENPDHARRLSSIHAERLENKDFLHRASFVSSISAISQDSHSLPPFARRSQQFDMHYGAGAGENEPRLSADSPTDKSRISKASSQGSQPPAAKSIDGRPSDDRYNVPSPVSPVSSTRSTKLPFENADRISSTASSPKRNTADTSTTYASMFSTLPHYKSNLDEPNNVESAHSRAQSSISSNASRLASRLPLRDFDHERTLQPQHAVPGAPMQNFNAPDSPPITTTELLIPPKMSGADASLPTSASQVSSMGTAELETAEVVAAPVKFQPAVVPKIVEKRASAVGHSSRGSRAFRHRTSNASRFSFQFGGSAAEEQALEEKHRKMAKSRHPEPGINRANSYDDDEDFFDEDAMDDLDEMEVQAAMEFQDFDGPGDSAIAPVSFLSMSDARAQLQSDSDSDLDEEHNNATLAGTSLEKDRANKDVFASASAAVPSLPKVTSLPFSASEAAAQTPRLPNSQSHFGGNSVNPDAQTPAGEVAVAGSSRVTNSSVPQQSSFPVHHNPQLEDDMYFDDGGFEADVNALHFGDRVDEDDFDDDNYLARNNTRLVPTNRESLDTTPGRSRDVFAMPGTDGPYPSFAMPNPARAKQRDSQMLLEDLPLHENIVDAQSGHLRNSSLDHKRLGISGDVPPLPTASANWSAMNPASHRLHAYHAALASAANKAAEAGRFDRKNSSSTTTSTSAYSTAVRDDVASQDRHSLDENNSTRGSNASRPSDTHVAPSAVRGGSIRSKLQGFSPIKTNFDFGFEQPIAEPNDSAIMAVDDGFDYDDDFDDPDMIAAANSEALASDDEGFYGHEFGFYAKARPNTESAPQPINGGFFGEDGDDGLTRNKSIKEPNLTPITERSEFSTRNSFIGGLGFPSSASQPRLSFTSPLFEGEITSFEELRKLRANAFGGSNGSLRSDGTRSSPRSASALNVPFLPSGSDLMLPTAGFAINQTIPNLQPIAAASFTRDNQPPSSSSSQQAFDPDATPRKPTAQKPVLHQRAGSSGVSVPRISTSYSSHSRKSSGGGGDSVTYVSEQENGQQRWVMERRRPSEHGEMELVEREVVQGGWI